MDLKGNSVTWLGHGSWLWETSEGKRLLIDPWLSGNPSCPDEHKDPGTLDGVLMTHGHFDHIGDAVDVLKARPDTPAFSIFELAMFLGGKGLENVTGFNKGGTVECAGVRVTQVDAAHSSGISDGDGLVEGGDPGGFILEFPDGLVVYQAGDTDVFSDMALFRDIYAPSVAVLPIGDFYTMGPRQAAHATKLLGVKTVIGGHWGTFPALIGTPTELGGWSAPAWRSPTCRRGRVCRSRGAMAEPQVARVSGPSATLLIDGATREARIAPRLPDGPPVAGDRVEVRETDDDLVVTAIRPRATTLQRGDGPSGRPRVVVANADLLAVVASVAEPP